MILFLKANITYYIIEIELVSLIGIINIKKNWGLIDIIKKEYRNTNIIYRITDKMDLIIVLRKNVVIMLYPNYCKERFNVNILKFIKFCKIIQSKSQLFYLLFNFCELSQFRVPTIKYIKKKIISKYLRSLQCVNDILYNILINSMKNVTIS